MGLALYAALLFIAIFGFLFAIGGAIGSFWAAKHKADNDQSDPQLIATVSVACGVVTLCAIEIIRSLPFHP